jgi:hypothetical protein
MVQLTPTFISILPHNTNIVEFPFPYAITLICVSLMIEHIVVNKPSRKTPIMPYFFRLFIWRECKNGIGRKMMMISKTIVVDARP